MWTMRPRARADSPRTHFLPELDNLLLSHAIRTRVVQQTSRPVYEQQNDLGTMLIDGFAGARWKMVPARRSATIVIHSFVRLSAARRTPFSKKAYGLSAFVAGGLKFRDIVISHGDTE